MDLLSISRAVWRHKLATVPVLLIMLVGMAYVLVGKKPVYEAKSSYILLPPPTAPPTTAPLRHPARKGASPNNPFTGYGNLSVVVDILSQTMTSPAEGQVLANQGVTGPYTVASLPSMFGNNGAAPIIQVAAQGPSPLAARASATLVGREVQSQLANIQAAQGTSKQYWIGSLELTHPDRAQQQASSKLRNLIAVIAVGVILLFVVVSVMNAREERKRDRQAAKAVLEEGGALGPDHMSAELALDGPGLPYAAESDRDPWDFDSQFEEVSRPPRDREDR
jgi:hypothetical protein